jgi:hypothetical protein
LQLIANERKEGEKSNTPPQLSHSNIENEGYACIQKQKETIPKRVVQEGG